MSGEVGDLVGIPFPYAELHATKRRPVMVLTPPDDRGDFIGLPITSVPTQENAVAITSTDLAEGALPKPSWIRYDKAFPLSESSIVKTYGHVGDKARLAALQ